MGRKGGKSGGEFCFTLTVTDIAAGSSVSRSVWNQATIWVIQAIDEAPAQFTFPTFGIDFDNGSELINAHLLDYCQRRKFTFLRSRSGNEKDGDRAEQKNRTHVRQQVGYLRYDTDRELVLLNQIWTRDALFTNYFLAKQNLVEKHRHGTKVTKRCDRAQIPYQRASAYALADGARATMDAACAGIQLRQPLRPDSEPQCRVNARVAHQGASPHSAGQPGVQPAPPSGRRRCGYESDFAENLT